MLLPLHNILTFLDINFDCFVFPVICLILDEGTQQGCTINLNYNNLVTASGKVRIVNVVPHNARSTPDNYTVVTYPKTNIHEIHSTFSSPSMELHIPEETLLNQDLYFKFVAGNCTSDFYDLHILGNE